MVGDECAGEMLTAPCQGGGQTWGAVRLVDYSLAQTAYALADSRLWLPGSPSALELKTAPLGVVGKRGLVHRDITGAASTRTVHQDGCQPNRYISGVVESQCQKRDAAGVRG